MASSSASHVNNTTTTNIGQAAPLHATFLTRGLLDAFGAKEPSATVLPPPPGQPDIERLVRRYLYGEDPEAHKEDGDIGWAGYAKDEWTETRRSDGALVFECKAKGTPKVFVFAAGVAVHTTSSSRGGVTVVQTMNRPASLSRLLCFLRASRLPLGRRGRHAWRHALIEIATSDCDGAWGSATTEAIERAIHIIRGTLYGENQIGFTLGGWREELSPFVMSAANGEVGRCWLFTYEGSDASVPAQARLPRIRVTSGEIQTLALTGSANTAAIDRRISFVGLTPESSAIRNFIWSLKLPRGDVGVAWQAEVNAAKERKAREANAAKERDAREAAIAADLRSNNSSEAEEEEGGGGLLLPSAKEKEEEDLTEAFDRLIDASAIQRLAGYIATQMHRSGMRLRAEQKVAITELACTRLLQELRRSLDAYPYHHHHHHTKKDGANEEEARQRHHTTTTTEKKKKKAPSGPPPIGSGSDAATTTTTTTVTTVEKTKAGMFVAAAPASGSNK